ncbi:hypothetical protein [Neobacillus sp. DY30]|uniref:hypothetical protein n=1 Tax=Neobacillus sp. DY30 TaxID=3047871 RepID=UPI0024C09746|nr:hypothetical protein [Neobacillus sp. DY30]WHY01807.1 hypothetical protein QNH29_06160 [Neobacillus sp. DY30]
MSETLKGGDSVQFRYEMLDGSTAEFLRKKESNMREIVGKAYTELGRELKEAQERLSKNGYGCFEKWCESIGFNKMQANRLIQRYTLVTNCYEQKYLLEDLPVSLTYEIAKPSAESTEEKRQAKQAVLNGDIKTLKEYRELEQRLRDEQERRKRAEQDYESIRQAFVNTQEEQTQEGIHRIDTSTEINGTALEFSTTVRRLLQSYAYLQNYKTTFASMNEISRDEYEKSFDALISFATQVRKELQFTRQGDVIIEMEGM